MKKVRTPRTGKMFHSFFAKILCSLSLTEFEGSQSIPLSKPIFWACSNQLNPAFFRRRNLVEQTGIRAKLNLKVNTHMQRHSTGYYLANKGCDTRLIQDHLGYKNITYTVRYTRTAAHRFEGLWR